MTQIQARYLTDSEGNRLGVFLGMEEYQYLLEELEELDAIRAYDQAKESGDEVISFQQAMAEIESQQQ